MRILRRKLRRDARRQRGQFIAIAITIFLGVALFGSSYDAYRNLKSSYDKAFTQFRFADLTITGGDAKAIASAARSTDGVAQVSERVQADLPFRIGDTKLTGRIVGLPAGHQPSVDRVDVLSGEYLSPTKPDGVLVEEHTADHFNLDPGSRLKVSDAAGRPSTVTSVGTASSPEYFWPALSRQELFVSADDFGVVFASERRALSLAGLDGPNQVLVYYSPGADAQSLDSTLGRAAEAAGATDVLTRAQQPSNSALQEDVSGFQELSIMFPLLFLTAAALATTVLMRRLVASQRPIIGTLRAAGFSRRQLLRHYLSYGLVTGAIGGVAGALVGVLLAGAITDMYTSELSIPLTVTELRPLTAIVGILFGLVTGLLAAGLPAWSASRIPPAEAMRSFAPTAGGSISVVERLLPPLRRLPARWLMTIRAVGRNRRRALSTVLGVILALVLVLVSWGMVDTVQILVDRQFGEIERQDAELAYQQGAGKTQLRQVRSTPGVAAAEPALRAPVTVSANGERYQTLLVGLEHGTTMHGFLLDGGGTTQLPRHGLLAGSALAGQLSVGVGSRVEVSSTERRLAGSEPIAGFLDEALGTYVYADLGTLEAAAASAGSPIGPNTVLVRFSAGADRERMRKRLSALPGVSAYEDSQTLRGQVNDYLGLFYAFVGVMLLFGGAMAFALIYNSMSSNISERRIEIATMRAAGAPHGMLARLVTAENLIIVLIGIVPGLVLGYLAAAGFMDSFSNDEFSFALQMRTSTLVLSALAIVLVALVSQIPGVRALRRLPIADVIRERGS